jgi:hypothetical protein
MSGCDTAWSFPGCFARRWFTSCAAGWAHYAAGRGEHLAHFAVLAASVDVLPQNTWFDFGLAVEDQPYFGHSDPNITALAIATGAYGFAADCGIIGYLDSLGAWVADLPDLELWIHDFSGSARESALIGCSWRWSSPTAMASFAAAFAADCEIIGYLDSLGAAWVADLPELRNHDFSYSAWELALSCWLCSWRWRCPTAIVRFAAVLAAGSAALAGSRLDFAAIASASSAASAAPSAASAYS